MSTRAQSRLAPRLATLEGARIAFIGNRKRNVAAFMRVLADAVVRREPGVGVAHHEKSSVYRAQPQRLVSALLEGADGVVVGPGD